MSALFKDAILALVITLKVMVNRMSIFEAENRNLRTDVERLLNEKRDRGQSHSFRKRIPTLKPRIGSPMETRTDSRGNTIRIQGANASLGGGQQVSLN
ncbi:hypothetical protein FSARC_3449 [Fusarium sarcochroum]|uniref:Uncharacterized protein n=1 Tax=Fusarium sarcochroum TaxID=1208366 RepID=A0A8H4U4D7_9HYPO|nr:hypothetical protein FSARC_3449 [Fusarium sarcochroum]